MRARKLFLSAAILLCAGALSPVRAQRAAPPAASPATPPAASVPSIADITSILGSSFAPMMMSGLTQGAGLVDPSHNNERILLKRNDVRSELLISARQKEQMDDLEKKSQAETATRMQEVATTSFADLKGVDPQNSSPDEVISSVKSGMQKMQDAMTSLQTDLDKRAEASLTPAQTQRLHQLDLQWRGPLALTDKAVADKFNLTTDQRSKLESAFHAYFTMAMNSLQSVFADITAKVSAGAAAPQDGSGTPNIALNFDPKDMMKRLSQAMRSDKVTKARKDAEAKAFETLTPAQQEQWKKESGPKFVFRIYDN